MRRNWLVRGLKIAALALVAAAVAGEVISQLWNALLPGLFGWHAISFWQALGLLILSRIFFGGFRGRPGYGGRWRQRWEQMTPEQREKFQQGMRGRCGKFEAPQTPA